LLRQAIGCANALAVEARPGVGHNEYQWRSPVSRIGFVLRRATLGFHLI
jgi:hypothetical protein